MLTSTDVAEVENAVREAYASGDTYTPHVGAAFVEAFGRERLAGMLAGVLEKAGAGSNQVRERPPAGASYDHP